MISVLLRAGLRPVMIFQIGLAVYLLLRGHNEPGGGFVAGLLAAGSFVLMAIAYDVERARTSLRLKPRFFMAAGLALAGTSGILGILQGQPFLTGLWFGSFTIPVLGKISVGTPLFFDIGVSLVVFGIALDIAFSMFAASQSENEKGRTP